MTYVERDKFLDFVDETPGLEVKALDGEAETTICYFLDGKEVATVSQYFTDKGRSAIFTYCLIGQEAK